MSRSGPSTTNPDQCEQAINPEVQQWFTTVDQDQSGQIDWRELQAALMTGQGQRFSEGACKLMIDLFDTEWSGTLDLNKFQQLFGYISQWMTVFHYYDKDRSGYIEEQELAHALQQMGYRFSTDFVKLLMRKSDVEQQEKVSVDQFVVVCIQIQRLTEDFRIRDKDMKGVVKIGFEDFLEVALNSYRS